jgi:hypothetical protein
LKAGEGGVWVRVANNERGFSKGRVRVTLLGWGAFGVFAMPCVERNKVIEWD